MSKIPPVPAKKIQKFLYHLGFVLSRQKGSHQFFRHGDGRTTVVPFHQGEDVGIGLISKILRDVEIDREYFIEWLNKN